MAYTYQTTHPWITFSIDALRRPNQKLWAMLGECQSKCEHLAGVALEPAIASRLHSLYLAKGIHGTTAIEGNTLSEKEISQYLAGKLTLPPSREYLAQEVQNIVCGLGTVLDVIRRGTAVQLNIDTFELFNSIVLDKLELEEGTIAGKIRRNSVGVFRYRGAPAEDCPYLLQRLANWLNGEDFTCPPDALVVTSILQAVLAHLYLAWIHPFGDGNGRTARLVEFAILFSSGVPTPASHLLSNHYNLTRTEYYRQLDYASASGGNIVPFVTYAVQGFLDGLKEQLEVVKTAQLDVIWRNHIYQQFGDTSSRSQIRRRNLVLDLSKMDATVKFSQLKSISQRAAIAYHEKNMLLVRDVNALREMKLILRSKDGISANKEIVKAFLPERADLSKIHIQERDTKETLQMTA